MNVTSREYKVILNPAWFGDPTAATERFWEELEQLAATLPGVRATGRLVAEEWRTLCFLDTPSFTIQRHGLLLRQRANDQVVQYTLKCRSEDRYTAAGTDLRPAPMHTQTEEKLEEDIAPPFRCRYAHSTTITLSQRGQNEGKQAPSTLEEGAALFPMLATLQLDGRRCALDTRLEPVHGARIHERVYTKAKLEFQTPKAGETEDASVALIMWSHGKNGRPVTTEFSFRLKDAHERFSRELAIVARSCHALVQWMDWSLPEAATKTEYVYRGMG